MKIAAPLIIAALALGSACTPTTAPPSPDAATPDVVVSQADTAALLAERRASYEEVFEQARLQGFLAGALRGLVLGALVDGERGALVGSALGAALGGAFSNTAAQQLLQEREEFLNRQQIIQNILDASRGATQRSVEDAALVSRAVSQFSTPAAPVDAAQRAALTGSIATMRQAVEMRALLLSELLQESDLTPDEQAQVQAEIDLQREALVQIRGQQDLWSAQTND